MTVGELREWLSAFDSSEVIMKDSPDGLLPCRIPETVTCYRYRGSSTLSECFWTDMELDDDEERVDVVVIR